MNKENLLLVQVMALFALGAIAFSVFAAIALYEEHQKLATAYEASERIQATNEKMLKWINAHVSNKIATGKGDKIQDRYPQ